MHTTHALLALTLTAVTTYPRRCAAYNIVRDYSGATFFDGWDFYGADDNLTNGAVHYLTLPAASASSLININSAGNAILRVDNTSYVPSGGNRNSIRITTQEFYDFGSLWVVDMVHMPFGCSVWPAFWSTGPTWPTDGEIDIVEGINLQPANQYALHTVEGCVHTTPTNQLGLSAGEVSPGSSGSSGSSGSGSGSSGDPSDCSTSNGCTVAETKPGSFGASFASAGGGVFAAQFDITGIFIWFFPRASIPDSLLSATPSSPLSLADWGEPSAAYVNDSSCSMTDVFRPQQLIFDITLCGDWAGLPEVYAETCSGDCYTSNVIGPGTNYDDAYFEIAYLRAYTTEPPGVAPTAVVGALANQQDSSATSFVHHGRGRDTTWAALAPWVVTVLVGTCTALGGWAAVVL